MMLVTPAVQLEQSTWGSIHNSAMCPWAGEGFQMHLWSGLLASLERYRYYILHTLKIWQRSSSTTYIYWYTLFHLYSWGSMSRFPLSSRSQEMCSFREMELWHSAVSKDCQTKQIVQSSIKSSCGFFEFYYNQDSPAKSQNCNLAPH